MLEHLLFINITIEDIQSILKKNKIKKACAAHIYHWCWRYQTNNTRHETQLEIEKKKNHPRKWTQLFEIYQNQNKLALFQRFYVQLNSQVFAMKGPNYLSIHVFDKKIITVANFLFYFTFYENWRQFGIEAFLKVTLGEVPPKHFLAFFK